MAVVGSPWTLMLRMRPVAPAAMLTIRGRAPASRTSSATDLRPKIWPPSASTLRHRGTFCGTSSSKNASDKKS